MSIFRLLFPNTNPMKRNLLFTIIFLLAFSSYPFTNAFSNNPCRTRDSLALVALYNSTNGANWTNSWDLAQPIDSWYGVSLSSEGCVTCLDLAGTPDCALYSYNGENNLDGTLPEEIGDLLDLETFYIHDNTLTGPIPSGFWNLTKLKHVRLNGTLTGTIPTDIQNLTNLEFFSLFSNNMTGPIPSEIQYLTKLTDLDFSFNNFSGNIPPEVGNLTDLKTLYFRFNNMDGTIPPEIGNLEKLTHLDMNSNNFTGSLPAELGFLENLLWFRISDNNLSGCFPQSYSYLCDLQLGWSFQFQNNPGLPGGGDWAAFCANQTGACPPTCTDGVQNGNETGVDCGGTCPIACHPLEEFLFANPLVGNEIVFMVDKTINLEQTFFQWNDTLKQKLYTLYDSLAIGIYPDFTDPLPNQDTTMFGITVLTDADAEKVYLSYVATSLYHEISGLLNWSIVNYSATELKVLFDWREFLVIYSNVATNFEDKFIINKQVTPSPPTYIKTNFFDAYGIIGSSEKQTIANILNYARDSMRHFTGSGAAAHYNQWQYYGAPPMSRVIEGTTRMSDGIFAHFTAGCHGTCSFSKMALMLLNIPVEYANVGIGHRIAVFPSLDNLFITHGDDPYNQGSKNPKIPGYQMLVDSAFLDNWFSGGNYNADDNTNVGRRINELAFNILPEAYKNAYCNDFNNTGNLGVNNYLANNYAGLANQFPHVLMDSIHFWDRLELSLLTDPNYAACFANYNQSIDYHAEAPVWEVMTNFSMTSDTALIPTDPLLPAFGRVQNCINPDNWAEMVVYNTISETWIGLGGHTATFSLTDMAHAIQVKNDTVTVYENGQVIAILQDTFELSVKWIKIKFNNNSIEYLLNGFVRHSTPISNPGDFYVSFGIVDPGGEINNFYLSNPGGNCCIDNLTVNNPLIPDNSYSAGLIINSTGVIPASGNVVFRADNEITLDPGFGIELGATFTTILQGCDN